MTEFYLNIPEVREVAQPSEEEIEVWYVGHTIEVLDNLIKAWAEEIGYNYPIAYKKQKNTLTIYVQYPMALNTKMNGMTFADKVRALKARLASSYYTNLLIKFDYYVSIVRPDEDKWELSKSGIFKTEYKCPLCGARYEDVSGFDFCPSCGGKLSNKTN